MSAGAPILKIGKHQARYPLIQGGMGVGISGANLAGHVSRCGAIGTIASVGLCHDSPHFSIKKHNYFEANAIVIKEVLAQARRWSHRCASVTRNCLLVGACTMPQAHAQKIRWPREPASGARLSLKEPTHKKGASM